MADTFTRDQVVVKGGPTFAPAPEGFDPFNPTSTAESKVEPEAAPVKAEPETPPLSEASADGSTQAETADSATATSAAPDGATPSESVEGETAPRRSEARERIEELVTERNALRKYGDYLLETIKQISTVKENPTATTTPVEKGDPAPTLEQFEYDPAKFSRAQNEWMQRQIDKQVKTAVEQIANQQTAVQMRQTFDARVSEFKKAKPDFDLVLANPTLPSLHQSAAAEIIKSTNGPALAYHLAKNPDLAARIARMEPTQQIMALGRVEAQLTTETATATAPKAATPQKTTRTVTQAPPPPRPVDTGTSVSTKPENLMSMDEWVAKERDRKIAEKEARRKMRSAMR